MHTSYTKTQLQINQTKYKRQPKVQAGWGHPEGHSPSLADASRLGYIGPATDSNATTSGYGWTCAVGTATSYDRGTPRLELTRSKR